MYDKYDNTVGIIEYYNNKRSVIFFLLTKHVLGTNR